MRQRTLVALSVLAVLAALYLLLFERAPRSAAEPALVFSKRGPGDRPIDRIDLAPRGQPAIQLQAEGAAVVILPARLPADPAAFAAMVNAAELLTVRRRLPVARPEYGLDAPRMQITIAGHTLALGADTTDGQGSYARVGGQVFVVDRELAAAFLRPVALPHVFVVAAEAPARLRITHAGRELVLERDINRRAFVTPPGAGRRRADYPAAQALLARLGELRALLPEPHDHVSAETPPAAADLRIELAGVTLTTAGRCPGHDEATAVRIERANLAAETSCVDGDLGALLGDLAQLADLLSDRALFDIPPDDVAEARVKVGARTLILRRSGGGFHVIPGGALAPFDADSDTVGDWLDGLFAARADQLAPLADARLDAAPSITLTTASGISERAQVLGSLGHRDDEDITLRLPAAVASWFDAEPVRFRDREIVSFNATDLVRVKRTPAGGAPEQIERDPTNAEAYLGIAPPGPVDAAAVLALRDALANLRAVRWTPQAAGPESGLTPPRARIEADLGEPAGARSIIIEVGANTPDGCFARRAAPPDPAVFVLDPARCKALTAPLHAP